ncbi:MAG: SMC-Scp complex subunit ScpB [Bdellovibrionales bacterium]|nr:SMC-Scp complex subunit ScpB [Bdellovibrionales bacterium]
MKKKDLDDEVPVSEEEFDEKELALSKAYWEDEEVEASDTTDLEQEELSLDASLSEGTELASFESAEIEETEFIEDERVESIIESLLFSSEKAVSISTIKQIFVGTTVKTVKIKKALENLAIEYAGARRGVSLEEVQGGYQLRTKVDNAEYLKRLHKSRPFKVSGPALETLAIVAYKQPVVKNEVDQIRGVESGHLMRALMDRRLINFVGKSDLPGKPMLYGTTKNFLQIFGLRNIGELPSLSEIDQLIPEGIGEEIKEDKETLSDVSENLGLAQGQTYSESEEELSKITEKLQEIDTTTAFFEEEKKREKDRLNAERAKEITEAIEFGEEVSTRDRNWLERYKNELEAQAQPAANAEAAEIAADEIANTPVSDNVNEVSFVEEASEALEVFDFDSEQDKNI